ncbi:hypothetical protein Hanom_Chr17g01558431 [Helianthus anomalus]
MTKFFASSSEILAIDGHTSVGRSPIGSLNLSLKNSTALFFIIVGSVFHTPSTMMPFIRLLLVFAFITPWKKTGVFIPLQSPPRS